MKYLLYCILRTGEIGEPGCPPGVDGQPVCLVACGGLSAVTSRIADAAPAPELPRILAYQKVVEAFHHAQTVIPLRYGCLVNEQSAIAPLLEARRRPFEGILKELDGCEELGIRIIPAGADPGATPADRAAASMNESAHGISWSGDSLLQPPAGQAYLAAQKLRYAARDRLTREEERIAGRVCAQLAEFVIRSRIEISAPAGDRLLSYYFLAPRGAAPAIRAAFRRLAAGGKIEAAPERSLAALHFRPDRPRSTPGGALRWAHERARGRFAHVSL